MKHILILFSLFLCQLSFAQLPTDLRSEQVAFSLQKGTVAAGDTLEVEGQVTCMAADRFFPYSNYLYVECVSGADSVLCRQKVSCKDKGYFHTRIPIDSDWGAGVYYLRAYTRLMMNFSPESFAVQPFLVSMEFPERAAGAVGLDCTTIVAGGHLLAGVPQHVALWLHNDTNFPLSMPLTLTDERGDTLGMVTPSRAGLALLSFVPQLGVQYYLQPKGMATKIPLPLVEEEGPQVQGYLSGKNLRFLINGTKEPDTLRLCSYDQMNGLMEYMIDGRTSGVVPLKGKPEVLTLFLTSKSGEVLSEYTLCTAVHRDSLSIAIPRELKVGEPLDCARLVALGDSSQRVDFCIVPDYEPAVPLEASLKYLADYRSGVPFPAEIYSLGGEAFHEALQAWLFTSSFKRFSVADVLDKGSEDIYSYMPEDNMTFSGQVTDDLDGTPLKGGSVVAYNNDSFGTYEGDVDKNGNFRIAVDDFTEGDGFYVQAKPLEGKKEYFYRYQFSPDPFPIVDGIAQMQDAVWNYVSAGHRQSDVVSKFADDDYSQLGFAHVVKHRVKKIAKVKDTRDFYNTRYADRDFIEKWDCQTLRQIIERMPGLKIDSEKIYTTRGYTSLNGKNTVPLFLDGYRVPDDEFSDDGRPVVEYSSNLLQMSTMDIEAVEYLNPGQALVYVSSPTGCINITTRSGKGSKPQIPQGIYYNPLGLTVTPQSEKVESWQAPKIGRYHLIMNVVGENDVRSYVYQIEVSGK